MAVGGNRGRPPVTRARVMHYLADHPGCTIMQIVRATGADRRHVQRMMRSLEKVIAAEFCRIAEVQLAA